jgi:hypothetical protein
MSSNRRIAWFWGCCNQNAEHVIWDAVNRQLSPELYDRLLAGELNRLTCPACGKSIPPMFPVLVHDTKKHLMVWIYEGPDDPVAQLDEGEIEEFQADSTKIISVEGFLEAANALRRLSARYSPRLSVSLVSGTENGKQVEADSRSGYNVRSVRR